MEKKASLVGRLLSENQMSEAFINSMFLALSGGFQDAYTYNCRDEVFSNAQFHVWAFENTSSLQLYV